MSPTINTTDAAPISQRVIEEVAAVTGTDPLEMEPLYTRVDPDCLESLFGDDALPESRNRGQLTFPMAGCQVVVHADGTIDVTPYSDLTESTPVAEGQTPSSNPVESPE